MTNLHLLRPYALLLLIPFSIIVALLWKKRSAGHVWKNVCDAHLLPYILCNKQSSGRHSALTWLFISIALLIIGLAGPSWTKFSVPSFKQVLPHVIVLSLSDAMKESDISPTRLERAKFIIQDIINHKEAGQFALLAYTSEPFVVSPLTEDGNTINALLNSLEHDIMPVTGHSLAPALQKAESLLKQAGYTQGEVLVLSATPPKTTALEEASALAQRGIAVSIMPILLNPGNDSSWQALANHGNGLLLDYNDTEQAISTWLNLGDKKRFYDQKMLEDIPLWKDEGRWFILVGALMLLVVFRRGWLQRIET